MHSRKLSIELIGCATGVSTLLQPLRLFVQAVFLPVGFTEPGVGKGVVFVKRKRMLENLDGTIKVFFAVVILEIASSLKVVIVGSGDLSTVALELTTLFQVRVHPEHLDGTADNCVFGPEGVAISHGKAVGAELAASERIDQNEIDA
jgi:hypothetical protein